jgi:N-methylhydantoinase B
MMGGYPGAVNRYRFTRDSDVCERMKRSQLSQRHRRAEGKTRRRCNCGSKTSYSSRPMSMQVLWSAAGGFGDPLERDPAKVDADVANGDVSKESALAIYGVVVGDAAATVSERERLRKARLKGSNGQVKKLNGKVTMHATENLAIRGKRWSCASCAADLGPLDRNYKAACMRHDRPIEVSNPIVGDPKRFIDPLPHFRQFCCPGCGG